MGMKIISIFALASVLLVSAPAFAQPAPTTTTAAPAVACKNFAIGPYNYSRLDRAGGPVPLDLTVQGCLDGSTAYSSSFHVVSQLTGSIANLQKTVDAVFGTECTDKSVEYGYTLSGVTIDSEAGSPDKQHARIKADVAARPCGIIPVKVAILTFKLNATHSTVHVHVELPFSIEPKTLALGFDSPVVTYVSTEQEDQITFLEGVVARVDKSKIFQDEVVKTVKGMIGQLLDPNKTAALKPLFHLGDNIPKDKLTNFELKTAQLSTSGGTLNFQVLMTGNVPKSFLEPQIKNEVTSLGLQ
jgi:hypothetical protein